jgi:hypothetical protein
MIVDLTYESSNITFYTVDLVIFFVLLTFDVETHHSAI